MSKRRPSGIAQAVLPQQPTALEGSLSVGHNVVQRLVLLVFGTALAAGDAMTLTPDAARAIGRALLLESDKAEGK